MKVECEQGRGLKGPMSCRTQDTSYSMGIFDFFLEFFIYFACYSMGIFLFFKFLTILHTFQYKFLYFQLLSIFHAIQ